ncbi:MAG: hypothetical protein JO192_02730 [Candidatus Eremiobacteraeota bacterium]|nr:hypothetical protein [Candidatus Eremiobacteraeota bacterium]
MRFGISLVSATLVVLAGFLAMSGGPLTIPAFHDGMAAPKTIAAEVVYAHRLNTTTLVSTR